MSQEMKRMILELKPNAVFPKGPTLTKEDKEALRQKELKQMKAKYGLQVSVTRSSFRFKPYSLSANKSRLCLLVNRAMSSRRPKP